MVWIEFLVGSAILVFAAIKMAEYADIISLRTGLGGMFVGTLLLAGATSLPELLTTLNSLDQNVPNLAAGNLFGSNMFNIFLLGLLDLLNQQSRILRRVATRHALTASLATLLIGMAVFFVLADVDLQVGWVGVDSLLIVAAYMGGVWVIRGSSAWSPPEPAVVDKHVPRLSRALLGFALTTGVLLVVTPWLVRSSVGIAEVTGLGTSFVGVALLGVVTSLPEMTTVIVAARIGAYDLAVGNLFGSNIFNMFALGLTDFFYTPGRFLGRIDPVFALVGLLGLILTSLGLIGNLARVERRLLFVEIDALLIILVYVAGLYLMYVRGIGV